MKIDCTSRRLRLLVLTSTFPRWQNDREPAFVFELCRRLVPDFEVIVLAPHTKNAAFHETMDGVEVRRFPYFFPRWEKISYEGGIVVNLRKYRWNYLIVPFFITAEFFATLYLSKKYRVDAIHAHWIIPQGALAAAVRKLVGQQPALLCTLHGSDLHGLKSAFFMRVKRWTASTIDHFTVVSHGMKKPLAALGGKAAISVIPMGVDLRQCFTPPLSNSRKPYALLCVGRLVLSKGIHHIIAAMPYILEKHPEATLMIVGDGPERTNLLALVKRLQLNTSVSFAGALHHTNIAEQYKRASLFISASTQEGFGLVLAEAMGCECPVLAADLPAIHDIITNGITGTLFLQEDSVDLAEKALFLLEHPETVNKMALAAREHVLTHFDWSSIAERYRRTITEMCEKNA